MHYIIRLAAYWEKNKVDKTKKKNNSFPVSFINFFFFFLQSTIIILYCMFMTAAIKTRKCYVDYDTEFSANKSANILIEF